jgi:flavin-binding protein dodecin
MVVKIIELIGVSEKNFEDAVNEAVRRASQTVKNISGVDIVGQSVTVKDGRIGEYRVHCKVAFAVEG